MTATANFPTNSSGLTDIEPTLTHSSGTTKASKTDDKKIHIVIEDANGNATMRYKGLESATPDEIVAKLVELGHSVDDAGRVVFKFEAPLPPHPPAVPEFAFRSPPRVPMPPNMPDEFAFKAGGPKAPMPPAMPNMVPPMPPQPLMPPQAPMPPHMRMPGHQHMAPPQPIMHSQVPGGSHSRHVMIKRDGNGGNVKVVIQSV